MENYNKELYHYGVPGLRWGHRKTSYKSTDIRSAIARRSNEKVDEGFKNRYLNNHQVSFNGQRVNVGSQNIRNVMDKVNKAKKFMGYMY